MRSLVLPVHSIRPNITVRSEAFDMAGNNKNILIIGDNNTSHRLQDKLSASNCFSHIHLLSQSDHRYFPRHCLPQLLAGILPIAEMETPPEWYHARKIRYICRHTEPDINYAAIVDTRPDARHVSVLKTAGDRSLYIPLHTPENIQLAQNHLQKSGGITIIGSSELAIQYATSVARAGFPAYLVADKAALINPGFDKHIQRLIYREIKNSGVKIIPPEEKNAIPKTIPVIYMPLSSRNKEIRHAQIQTKNIKISPTDNLDLPDGGDHFTPPESILNMFASRCWRKTNEHSDQFSLLRELWLGKPDLPHRISVNKFAIHYAGSLNAEKNNQCLTMHIPECGICRKIIIAGDRIIGFILAGDVRGSETLADMMLTHRDIRYCRDQLLFSGHQAAVTYP